MGIYDGNKRQEGLHRYGQVGNGNKEDHLEFRDEGFPVWDGCDVRWKCTLELRSFGEALARGAVRAKKKNSYEK